VHQAVKGVVGNFCGATVGTKEHAQPWLFHRYQWTSGKLRQALWWLTCLTRLHLLWDCQYRHETRYCY
jgi:hypothetical protein